MNKSGHLVTVPREYLEELEKFKENNRTDYNAKLVEKGTTYYENRVLFLEVDSSVVVNFFNYLIMTDDKGRELAKFTPSI
ncbi:MAG: hypothetical protein ABS939_15700 [Psychrobacillus sp.]